MGLFDRWLGVLGKLGLESYCSLQGGQAWAAKNAGKEGMIIGLKAKT